MRYFSRKNLRLNGLLWLFFIQIVILSVSFTGCQKKEKNKLPGFIYFRLNSNPTTLDPALIVDVASANIAAKLFNGLVRFGNKMEIVPDIACKLELSGDGERYCFDLRPNVQFSNGREVTASDFKYSFERILNPRTRSPRTWVFSRIKGSKEYTEGKAREVSGIKARGKYRLEIFLAKPFALFLQFLALPTAYCVPMEEVEKWKNDFSFHPVGTGPFILEEWRNNLSLKMVVNEHYFADKAKVKGIIYRIIPEDLTAVYEFSSGNLDLLPIPQAEFRRFVTHPQWKGLIKEVVGLNTYYLGLNCQRPPFDNPKVRQAMNYSIDREKILKTMLEGRGQFASGPIPPALLKEKVYAYAYDPDKARSLLKEAGYPNGFAINIYQSSDQETLEVLEVIQKYLEKVGIKAQIFQREWSSFKEALNKGEADAFWLSWWADYPDAENFLYPTFHSGNWGAGGNRAYFKDKKIDQLIEEAQRTMITEKRLSIYREIERRIVDQAPWVFFWHKKDYVVTQPWVKGVKLYPLPGVDKGTEVSLDTETRR
jgi:peptide/nickel transport system substrate-binding protein/oligopeptide transport system substrate-binding protein